MEDIDEYLCINDYNYRRHITKFLRNNCLTLNYDLFTIELIIFMNILFEKNKDDDIYNLYTTNNFGSYYISIIESSIAKFYYDCGYKRYFNNYNKIKLDFEEAHCVIKYNNSKFVLYSPFNINNINNDYKDYLLIFMCDNKLIIVSELYEDFISYYKHFDRPCKYIKDFSDILIHCNN